MKIRFAIATAGMLLGLANVARSQDVGDWIVRVGVLEIVPKSGNSPVVEVDSATGLTFSGAYMFAPHWAAELLAALPFEHDVSLLAGGKVATVKQLPPTLSLQYHFYPNERVRPYVGVGVNYTTFFDESTTGALQGSQLELDDSFGLAAQAGVDFALGSGWFMTLDGRYFDIDTDASLDGQPLGKIQVDPLTFGVSIGVRF